MTAVSASGRMCPFERVLRGLRVRVRAALACAAIGLGLAAPAAAEGEPEAVGRYLGHARLVGDGTLRWLGFRVYDARLWAPPGVDMAERWVHTPFVLEIEYAWALRGAAIAERSRDEMLRLGYGTAERRQQWLEAMRMLFPDVQAGTRLIGVHRPGQGATFYSEASRLGHVADPEFARAFFAIWLDARTSDPALREALLSGAGARSGR
ncbi:MAG: chalcone isomerase family protein [Burkholderiales bacterium]|nr:MAG: chalcone isomerase family protein [Burkholderiales bacterium]